MPIGLKGDSGSIPLVAVFEKAKSLLLVKGEKSMIGKQELTKRLTAEKDSVSVQRNWIKGFPEVKTIDEYLKGLDYVLNTLKYNDMEKCADLLCKELADTIEYTEKNSTDKNKRGRVLGLYFAYQLFKGETPNSLAL
jgi:hypothetical protein